MLRFLAMFAMILLAQPAVADKRAFVLSNAAYTELSDLENTHADADAYSNAISGFGYQVSQHRDLSRLETVRALDAFLNSVGPGDEVMFVYAGHGWSDGTVNYLVPTDAPRKASTRVLKRQSFALRNGVTGVLDDLETLGVSLTVAIIDACRDNPFEPLQGSRSVGLSRGLARVSAPQGTFVIFSAGEGQQALDGLPDDPPEQNLSVFTRVFVPLLVSGVTLETAISSAQIETARLALRSNGHVQHPAYYDQTLGNTCLKGDCLPPRQVATPPPNEMCNALYQEAKSQQACFAYEAYAKSCPGHIFLPLAQSFMEHNCARPKAEIAGLGNRNTESDESEAREMNLGDDAETTEDSLRLTRAGRREIQQRLKLIDHDPGGADGIFGDRTRKAISSWQAANGIEVTGYVDRDQINDLKSQSEAAYLKFTAAQRNLQKSTPKSTSRTKPVATQPESGLEYNCRHPKINGWFSATEKTEKLAREAVLEKCKRGNKGSPCFATRVYCRKPTG